jgi:hypothetical protein
MPSLRLKAINDLVTCELELAAIELPFKILGYREVFLVCSELPYKLVKCCPIATSNHPGDQCPPNPPPTAVP